MKIKMMKSGFEFLEKPKVPPEVRIFLFFIFYKIKGINYNPGTVMEPNWITINPSVFSWYFFMFL